MSDDPRDLLESSRIQWARDWDAVAVGFVLGALIAVAVMAWYDAVFSLPIGMGRR